MNITYLIGNGFDVNIGLNSRYADFYRYYVKHQPENEADVVKRFKEGINTYIKNETQKDDLDTIDWRDLEVALGQFTEKMTIEEGEPLYLDINDNLKEYLLGEYRYFDPEAYSKEEFINHLLNPVTKHFNRNTVASIKRYMASINSEDFISIINFNYTNSIEDLTGFKGTSLPLGGSVAGRKAYLQSLFHIHQTLKDEEILVGVNDVSQIANKQFQENRFLSNLYIKPRTNALLGTGISQDCEAVIANTDLFVLFGTSAGITDKDWWRAVCERLVNSNARLIYFVHCTKKRPHMNLYLEDMRDEEIKKLFTSAGLNVESIFNNVIKRCYVSFPNTMFKLPVTYNNRLKQEKTYKIGNSEVTMKILEMDMKHVVVSVDAPGEESGVPAESMWLKDYFPGYTHNSQHLLTPKIDEKEVPFDYIPIHNKNNRKDIYFEISSYLGKTSNYIIKSAATEKKLNAFRSLLKEFSK